MDQILLSLTKIKSTWDLLRDIPIIFENVDWDMITVNLIPLFRKDTFFNMIGKKNYYPQQTPNCRYYIKPNDGSCGKGIQITHTLPLTPIDGYTICPEIITPLILVKNKKCKYDYRVWIGICTDLTYFICPTLIRRISTIPFSLDTTYGSLTNTSLYSEQFNYQNDDLYNKIDYIVKDVLIQLLPNTSNISDTSNTYTTYNRIHLMLTGWDFIENEYGELFVLEVNCNPSINIQHTQVMTEFLNWISLL